MLLDCCTPHLVSDPYTKKMAGTKKYRVRCRIRNAFPRMHATQVALQTAAEKLLDKSRGSEEHFQTPEIALKRGLAPYFAPSRLRNRQATATARCASTCLISRPQARDASRARRAARANKTESWRPEMCVDTLWRFCYSTRLSDRAANLSRGVSRTQLGVYSNQATIATRSRRRAPARNFVPINGADSMTQTAVAA
jgi:hypothetical protein